MIYQGAYKQTRDAAGNSLLYSPAKEIIGIDPESTPILEGLQFWGEADQNLFKITNGVIEEAYDVRTRYGSSNKMIQSTAANRGIWTPSGLQFDTGAGSIPKFLQYYTTSSASSAFIICRFMNLLGATNTPQGIGGGLFNYFGAYNNGMVGYYNNTNYAGAYYTGTTRRTAAYSSYTAWTVYHSESFTTTSPIKIGALNAQGYSVSATVEIMGWGWYNRTLTTKEILINVARLGNRYKITV